MDGTSVRIALHGAADLATHRELDLRLAAIGPGVFDIVLDLRHLAFSDVATVRRLAHLARVTLAAGGTFATEGARPVIRQVAQLTDVDADLHFRRRSTLGRWRER